MLLMRRYLLPRCFLARALLIVLGYGVVSAEARLATHAEVPTALPVCSSAADCLRLRSHESRLYHCCSGNTGISTAFFDRDNRGIVRDTIELLKEAHQDRKPPG